MELVECFMKTGFTRIESLLYISLCREGELTGYEAAKVSGIPRSNAYLALAGLVEKGGAYRIEGEAAKFIAVPVTELIKNVRGQFNEALDFIEKNVPKKESVKDPFITITGKTNMINKMKNMIDLAQERIYISVSSSVLELVREELEAANKRNLKVVVITTPGFNMEQSTLYYRQKELGHIRMITDTTHVLTGEIEGNDSATCLYCKNKNLIQLIKDSLTNEIKLIERQA